MIIIMISYSSIYWHLIKHYAKYIVYKFILYTHKICKQQLQFPDEEIKVLK